jgi:hypothetical protein
LQVVKKFTPYKHTKPSKTATVMNSSHEESVEQQQVPLMTLPPHSFKSVPLDISNASYIHDLDVKNLLELVKPPHKERCYK